MLRVNKMISLCPETFQYLVESSMFWFPQHLSFHPLLQIREILRFQSMHDLGKRRRPAYEKGQDRHFDAADREWLIIASYLG